MVRKPNEKGKNWLSPPPPPPSTCTLPPSPFIPVVGCFSTRRLIPLLTAGQQVNPGSAPSTWMGGPPLMELRFGGAPLRLGNDILASPRPAASISPRPLAHAGWSRSIPRGPAGPRRRHTQRRGKLFGCQVCARKTKKYKRGSTLKLGCYYKHTCSIPGIRASTPERLPVSLPSCLVRVVTELHPAQKPHVASIS